MKLETLLPLGKVDPGLRKSDQPLDLHSIAEQARVLEDAGYWGLVTEETKDDPFVVMALAAQATEHLQLATGVTIAFPRSPAVTAMSAWTIQKLSRGRFTLGLGTQVRGHIVRRYGVDWHAPASWMRDYVGAVRAFWQCWQTGGRLDYQGTHYKLNLMGPLFNPGPLDHPHIPIHLAAVKPVMSRVAGEVADGIRPHPVCTPSYIQEVMIPAVQSGAREASRSLETFDICMKPLVATARNERELEAKVEDARARIAFYASTPAYEDAFIHHGLEGMARKAQTLSKSQKWEELPALIDNETLEKFAVIGTYDYIAERILDRWSQTVTRMEFSIAVNDERDLERLKGIAEKIQSAEEKAARQRLGRDPEQR